MAYRTIVVDPPWNHSDGTGVKFGIGDRVKRPLNGPPISTKPCYAPMSLSTIKALDISSLAAEGAHLYLWVTNRYLRHVWDVAEAWGFTGVSIQTWCKRSPGYLPGGTFPSNTEFFLFARRGRLAANRRAPGQWFEWPRRVGPPVSEGRYRNTMHSAKPEHFYDLVEQVSPGPYVELFARRHRLGWDVWGNESANTAVLAVC